MDNSQAYNKLVSYYSTIQLFNISEIREEVVENIENGDKLFKVLDETLEKYRKGNKESKGDKDNIERIVKFLREKYKFNELLEYVSKNSLEKDNTVEKIEKAYEELINDYIEFVYKSK